MGSDNFSDEFKRNAVAQITERGYPVAEVSQRLGVSQHSLYAWNSQSRPVRTRVRRIVLWVISKCPATPQLCFLRSCERSLE